MGQKRRREIHHNHGDDGNRVRMAFSQEFEFFLLLNFSSCWAMAVPVTPLDAPISEWSGLPSLPNLTEHIHQNTAFSRVMAWNTSVWMGRVFMTLQRVLPAVQAHMYDSAEGFTSV